MLLPQVNMISSRDVPAMRMFLTTTLAVVMFTVFIQVAGHSSRHPAPRPPTSPLIRTFSTTSIFFCSPTTFDPMSY